MGVKNNEEKAPVKRILPDTLHEFLDDCIESEGKIERIKIFRKGDLHKNFAIHSFQTDIMLLLHKGIFFLGIITDDDLRITFDYGFLAPPLLDAEVLLDFERTCKDLERSDSTTRHARPETEALWYMSQSQVGNLIIHILKGSLCVCLHRYQWYSFTCNFS